MADRISSFPDSILCYILSFLPTKQVVATSVLSKRWNPLWRSVPSLDFDHVDFNLFKGKESYFHFPHSVYSFLLCRDMDQPLHRFRLRSGFFYCPLSIMTWIKAAMRRSCRVEHLDLDLNAGIVVPSVVLSCKNLVVLRLTNITVKDVSFVDLPLLKILHLNYVFVSECLYHSQLLSGSPNLEDLEVKSLFVNPAEKCLVADTEGQFNRLPKLVRANIHSLFVPLEIVKNVEVLFVDWIYQPDLGFDFQNLIQLEFTHLVPCSKEWLDVLEVLKHCPKLQTLVIDIDKVSFAVFAEAHEGALLPYPQPVPTCISLYLKTCCLKNYRGSVDEFQFAKYIMQNAKYLRTMKICTDSDADHTNGKKLDMIRDLSSCRKSSDTCTLSFE